MANLSRSCSSRQSYRSFSYEKAVETWVHWRLTPHFPMPMDFEARTNFMHIVHMIFLISMPSRQLRLMLTTLHSSLL